MPKLSSDSSDQPLLSAWDAVKSVPVEIDLAIEQHLLETNQALQEQIDAHTQFTHLLIHQLATPLTSIQGSIHLLSEPGLQPEHQQEFLTLVQQQVHQLKGLLHGLTELRNLDTGTLETHPVAFAVPDLIQESARLLSNHPVVYHFSSDFPEVWGDRWQVFQVVLNLLSNAIKYSPTDKPIEVGARLGQPGWIEAWVRDQGLGIPLADQPHLFERFYRVKHHDRSTIKGTGLGLSLCKLLIENQGGEIGFESVHGEGSRFYFTLPIAHSK